MQTSMKCRKVPKGKRDMKKDQGLPELSAREISQKGKEALARAVKNGWDPWKSTPQGPCDRAEQMNRVDRNTGIHMLKRTEILTRLWNSANPYFQGYNWAAWSHIQPRGADFEGHQETSSTRCFCSCIKAIKCRTMDQEQALWRFIRLDKVMFSPHLPVLYFYFFIEIKSKTLKWTSLVYLLWSMAKKEKRIV